ncbi:RNA-directed DNA polymerase [Striga asiatica]|uniref:RNA-directed DNA polymerase n=1 Tax=Striga asiatica TaxID=4170 RepID=A0A5A7QNV5_STRAF|nr:RNA-directed DNA polymerase [Striga asiatica]
MDQDSGNPATKKVRNREEALNPSPDLAEESPIENSTEVNRANIPSFKESLLQNNPGANSKGFHHDTVRTEPGDVTYTIEDGMPAVNFADRIKKKMEYAMSYSLVGTPGIVDHTNASPSDATDNRQAGPLVSQSPSTVDASWERAVRLPMQHQQCPNMGEWSHAQKRGRRMANNINNQMANHKSSTYGKQTRTQQSPSNPFAPLAEMDQEPFGKWKVSPTPNTSFITDPSCSFSAGTGPEPDRGAAGPKGRKQSPITRIGKRKSTVATHDKTWTKKPSQPKTNTQEIALCDPQCTMTTNGLNPVIEHGTPLSDQKTTLSVANDQIPAPEKASEPETIDLRSTAVQNLKHTAVRLPHPNPPKPKTTLASSPVQSSNVILVEDKPPDLNRAFHLKPKLKIQYGSERDPPGTDEEMEAVTDLEGGETVEDQRRVAGERLENDHRIESVGYSGGAADQPWLVFGDFNAFTSEADKIGGRRSTGCSRFREWIVRAGMMDLGFEGSRFTWKWGRVHERLDRALVNEKWDTLFGKTVVKHLPRAMSDHSPLLISFRGRVNLPKRGGFFKYWAAWEAHDKWEDWLTANWNNDLEFPEAIWKLTANINDWKYKIFGDINKRKKKLLREEYEATVSQEDLLRTQNARAVWLSQGDRNTKHFHSKFKDKRKGLKIRAIQLEDGSWVSDVRRLGEEATNFFRNV